MNCNLKVRYYENHKIKSIIHSCCNQRVNYCKECGSTKIVWDKLDIVCLSCGLIHENVSINSESDNREDIPITLG